MPISSKFHGVLLVMKKITLVAAVAVSATSAVAHAEDGFTLYGVLDVAVASQNKSLGISPTMPNQIYPYQATSSATVTNAVTGLINGGLSDSRVGVKGEKSLGDQLKAIFDVESGFDITTASLNNAAASLAANPKGSYNSVNADSSLNGQLFNRAAWAGLTDAGWGTLTFGLQNNPMKDVFGDYDPVKSDTFSPFGESGAIGGGGGISENARMSNSAKYSKTFSNGVNVALAYQVGNNTGTPSMGNGYAVRAGYENSNFGVQAVYNNFTDAVKAVASGSSGMTGAPNPGIAGDIGLKVYNTDSYLLAGKYKMTSDSALDAGWEHVEFKAPSAIPTFLAPASFSVWGYPVSDVAAGMSAGKSQAEDIYFLGGNYGFTPNLDLSAGYYATKIGNTTGTSNTNATINTLSAVLDYRFTKIVDAYAAVTANNFGGDANATSNGNVTAYGVGLRVKF
jgi:predicted porin